MSNIDDDTIPRDSMEDVQVDFTLYNKDEETKIKKIKTAVKSLMSTMTKSNKTAVPASFNFSPEKFLPSKYHSIRFHKIQCNRNDRVFIAITFVEVEGVCSYAVYFTKCIC